MVQPLIKILSFTEASFFSSLDLPQVSPAPGNLSLGSFPPHTHTRVHLFNSRVLSTTSKYQELRINSEQGQYGLSLKAFKSGEDSQPSTDHQCSKCLSKQVKGTMKRRTWQQRPDWVHGVERREILERVVFTQDLKSELRLVRGRGEERLFQKHLDLSVKVQKWEREREPGEEKGVGCGCFETEPALRGQKKGP